MVQIQKVLPNIHERYYIDEKGQLYTNYGKTKMSNNYIRNISISNTLNLISGERKQFNRHRLMMLVFNLVDDDNDLQVNHKDGNKLNNNLNNLEWCTAKQNTEHAIKTGLRNNEGENHYNHKLTEKEVLDISFLLQNTNFSISKIARDFNVSRRTIGRIKNKETWVKALKE